TMGSHLRIEKRLIDKRFIFFRISIAVSCFSAFFLILLTKVSRHYITREIAPLHPFSNIFVITDKGKELGCSHSRLVIIIHKIDLMSPTICSARAPIIYYVVAKIQFTAIKPVTIQSPSQAPISTVVMRQQVVVKAADLSTDTGCIPMHFTLLILAVPRRVQRFGN